MPGSSGGGRRPLLRGPAAQQPEPTETRQQEAERRRLRHGARGLRRLTVGNFQNDPASGGSDVSGITAWPSHYIGRELHGARDAARPERDIEGREGDYVIEHVNAIVSRKTFRQVGHVARRSAEEGRAGKAHQVVGTTESAVAPVPAGVVVEKVAPLAII